jgi:hypothetical protein
MAMFQADDAVVWSHAIKALKPSRSTSSKSVSAPLKSSKNPTRMNAIVLFRLELAPLVDRSLQIRIYSF